MLIRRLMSGKSPFSSLLSCDLSGTTSCRRPAVYIVLSCSCHASCSQMLVRCRQTQTNTCPTLGSFLSRFCLLMTVVLLEHLLACWHAQASTKQLGSNPGKHHSLLLRSLFTIVAARLSGLCLFVAHSSAHD